MVGKAKIFSDQNREAVYQKEVDDENYASAAQQNSYNLGSVHFSDQSGIGNFTQAGSDQRKANLKGALFTGNVGFDLQTARLDIGTFTIDLNEDGSSTVLSIISTDRIVTLSAGTTGDLVTIVGPQRPGQRLFLYGIQGNTITIKNTAAATVNTILTPNGNDVVLADTDVVQLLFDITTAKWRVVAGPGGGATGTGTYASAVMDQDQVANMGVNDHFQFNDYVENGGIVLQGLTPTFDQTSGIFELKAGKTYSLEADVSGEFNSNADSAQIAWYDRTNAVELGARGKSNPLSSAGQLTNKHSVNTIFTPVTDIEVEVRIVALSGTINTAFANSSQANIFEFSGSGGGGGSNVPNGTAINDHLQWDGLGWVAQQLLNFDNNTIGLAFRNFANTGDVEIKVDPVFNYFDITNSAEDTVGLNLRAQDAIDPDNNFTLFQAGGLGGASVISAPTNLNLEAAAQLQMKMVSGLIDVFNDMDFNNSSSINEVARVSFSNTSGAGNALNNTIYSDPINAIFYVQMKSTDKFRILQDTDINNDIVASFDKGLIDFSHQLGNEVDVQALLVKNISQFNENMRLLTNGSIPQPSFSPTTDIPNPNDGGDLGTTTVPWNNLNVKQLRLRDGAVIVDIASIAFDSAFTGIVYNVPNNNSHLFKEFDNGVSTNTLFEINATEIDAFVKNIVNVVDPVNPQDAATKKYVDDNVGPGGGGDIFAQVVKEFSLPTAFNNTTLTNDAELKFQAEAQKVYYIEFNLKCFSSNAADIKFGMSIPTAATYQMAFSSLGVDFTDPPTASGGTTIFFSTTSSQPLSANFFVIVEMGVNAGEVSLSFAQQNADTSNTTIQRGSLMRAYEQGSGGGAGGVTQDILLGVIDEPEFRVEDINRQWIGNDNSENNLNINLGTSEPGGFTNTYTIDSNDFPDTPAGWEFVLFGMMGTWTVENTGASSTYEYKIFINGREISNQTGTVTLWLSPSAYTTLDDVQSGDTIQIKVWSTSASTDLYLRQRGIFLFPKAAKCIADMISVTPTPTANTFVATLPDTVTATLTTGEVAEYYVTNDEVWNVDDDGFPDFEPYNYGFVQILLNAEQIIRIPEWDRDTRASSGSTNVFQVPEWQVPYGKYRTTS